MRVAGRKVKSGDVLQLETAQKDWINVTYRKDSRGDVLIPDVAAVKRIMAGGNYTDEDAKWATNKLVFRVTPETHKHLRWPIG